MIWCLTNVCGSWTFGCITDITRSGIALWTREHALYMTVKTTLWKHQAIYTYTKKGLNRKCTKKNTIGWFFSYSLRMKSYRFPWVKNCQEPNQVFSFSLFKKINEIMISCHDFRKLISLFRFSQKFSKTSRRVRPTHFRSVTPQTLPTWPGRNGLWGEGYYL